MSPFIALSMISLCWKPLKYNNESRIWVEWDITIQYLLIFDLQNKLLHHVVDEPTLSPHCGCLWVLHLLDQPLPQNHTCFPVSQTHVPDSICVASVKCRSFIVACYLGSFLVSLWTDGFPIAMVLCLSWLTYQLLEGVCDGGGGWGGRFTCARVCLGLQCKTLAQG